MTAYIRQSVCFVIETSGCLFVRSEVLLTVARPKQSTIQLKMNSKTIIYRPSVGPEWHQLLRALCLRSVAAVELISFDSGPIGLVAPAVPVPVEGLAG